MFERDYALWNKVLLSGLCFVELFLFCCYAHDFSLVLLPPTLLEKYVFVCFAAFGRQSWASHKPCMGMTL